MDTIRKKCRQCNNDVEITLITTSEAGKIEGITNKSILLHVKHNKLPACRPGKEYLIQPEDLKLIANRKPGNPHTKK
jgi:hypothetical protein